MARTNIQSIAHGAQQRHYLLVQRYDRQPGVPGQRLHQEDFCQALGIVSEHKYQNEGGPGLAQALAELLAMPDPVRKAADRIDLFLAQAPDRPFRRKDYMNTFPRLSTASASRDLRDAVAAARLVRAGDGRTAASRKQ